MKILERIVLISLFFSLSLFGSGFDDITTIFTYGDVTYLKFIVTAVQKGVDSDAYYWFVRGTTFIAIIAIGIKLWQEKDLMSLAKHGAFPLIIIGFLNTTTTVHIEDQRIVNGVDNGSAIFATIDDVPSMLAVMYGTSSIFKYIGTEIVEEALVTIDGEASYSTAKLGFAKGMTTLLTMTDILTDSAIVNSDKDLKEYMNNFKRYTKECALVAVTRDTTEKAYLNLIAPHLDIIEAIEAETLGLDDNDKIDNGSGTEITCQDYWSEKIVDQRDNAENILLTKLSQQTDVNLSSAASAVAQVGAIDFGGSDLSSIKAYSLNVSLISPINSAIVQNNMGIQTSLEFANSINSQAAISQIQTSGIGIGRWFATIAPFALHILEGVLYFYGLFIPAIAIMLGYGAGLKYLMSYFGSLIGMAAVGIGMSVSSDIMSYFASQHMVELVSTLGSNPATVSGLKQYYIDMATYTGVVGFLGSMMALIAPSLILKGQGSAAINAIGSLSSMYKGGVENAEDSLAKEEGSRKAYEAEKEEIARTKLGNAGFSTSDIPQNMSASDYYNKVVDSASKAGASWGTYNAGHAGYDNKGSDDLIKSSAQSSMYQQTQKMGNVSEFASRIESAGGGQVAHNSGRMQGALQASSIEADSLNIDSINAVHDGGKSQASKKLGGIAGYADIGASEAFDAGVVGGRSAASSDKGTLKGVEKGGIENYLKGIEAQSAQKVSETAGFGKNIDLNKAMNKSFDDGSVKAHNTNATDDLREKLKNSKDKDIKWSAQKIGKGQAVSAVHNETKAQGTFNALNKDGDYLDAFEKASSGSEEQGRVGENTLLGIGNKWEKLSNKERMSMMKKVQENAEVGEFGKIESTNAEIHKHKGGVDGAIKDMVTSAQQQGIQSATHAENLREKYGSNLNDAYKDNALA